MDDDYGVDVARPIAVLIGGFLSDRGHLENSPFWGMMQEALHAQGFRVLTVSPSPVGSLHDRACQIFYELKGGTVCFGQEHSRVHRHACYGEMLEGKFPQWGENNPIHLIGHSFGGQTARVLQHLIATGFFSNPREYTTNTGWVRSLTACNSPLNGSLLVYSLGEKDETAPAVRLGSVGHLLSVVIHVVELLDWGFLRRAFDPRLSHFELSVRHLGPWRAWAELWRTITADSRVFMGEDNAAFDMTLHSAHRWNRIIKTDQRTFYFSITGSRSYTSPRKSHGPAPSRKRGLDDPDLWEADKSEERHDWKSKLLYSMLQWLHRRHVRRLERTMKKLLGSFPELWNWFGHDGVLETFTQSHPRVPQDCESPVSIGFPSEIGLLKSGIWHNVSVAGDHLWMDMDVDEARAVCRRLAISLRLTTEVPDEGPVKRSRSASRRGFSLHPQSTLSPCSKSPKWAPKSRVKVHGVTDQDEAAEAQFVGKTFNGGGFLSPLEAFSKIRESRRARCDVHSGQGKRDLTSTKDEQTSPVDDIAVSRSDFPPPSKSHHLSCFVWVAALASVIEVLWSTVRRILTEFLAGESRSGKRAHYAAKRRGSLLFRGK